LIDPLREMLPKLALDTGLQAVGGPEDQRRPRQGQRSQPGEGPYPLAGSEQKDAKADVEDSAGNANPHPHVRVTVFP
jgi:hypothetical protein